MQGIQRRGKQQQTRRGGFTLLEVLLVIGIIALLAAFVVPQFMGTEQQAKIKTTQAMVSTGGNLATTLELYRSAVGEYPEDLKYLYEKPDDEDKAAKWGGPYITNPESLKDAWSNDLIYKYPGDVREGSYDLSSAGPDGDEGTDDDITNWKKE